MHVISRENVLLNSLQIMFENTLTHLINDLKFEKYLAPFPSNLIGVNPFYR